MQGRVGGSARWSVPMAHRAREVDVRRSGTGSGRDGDDTANWFAPGWMLLEFPTAILMAVFVGTGWLGYAQHGRLNSDTPIPAVVVPAPGDAAAPHEATAAAHDGSPAAGVGTYTQSAVPTSGVEAAVPPGNPASR
ncbi:hypothetical protein [Nocardia alni]|uniref:hypothetical protein n=1 Tax=Nocardia alni TaxID=2815723 RepID=UPI001C21C3B8|nr:hypothetical protein [Nocardia alni]